MTSPQRDRHYKPAIDGLRALAVIAVVVFHAFPKLLPGGFVGVDVFFVISGFLIAGLIFDGLDTGTFRVRDFYARRIRRLVPALVTVLLATLVLGWFVLLPSEYAHLGRHTAGGAAFIANVLLWNEAGYFDIASTDKPLLHLWSLGVEEQFYLVAPCAAIALWHCPRRFRSYAVWALLLASFAFNIALERNDPTSAFFSPLSRFWELLAGVQLAVWSRPDSTGVGASTWRRVQQICVRHSLWVSAIGMALIVTPFFMFDDHHAFFSGWLALPVIGTVMLLATGNHGPINTHWLASPPMVLVGLLSYSIYLWHWPLLALLHIIEGAEAPASLRVAAVILAILLAAITWHFIETPLRRSRTATTIPGLLLAALVIGTAGTMVNIRDGLPQRRADQIEQLQSLNWGPEMNASDACRERFRASQLSYCLESTPGVQPAVVLVGDSTANQYFWALKAHYDRLGMGIINLGRMGCPVLRDVETTRHERYACLTTTTQVLDEVLRTPSIKTVILVDRWSRDVAGGLVHTRQPQQRDPAAILRAAIETTVAELSQAGKRVVILTGIPELPYPATRCVRTRPFYFSDRSDKDRCVIARTAVEQQAASYRPMLSTIHARQPALSIIDPATALCDDHWCHGKVDGVLVFRDVRHLSSAGAEIVIDKIFQDILGAASHVAAEL